VIDRLMTFLDSMDGGAWSHLVGAVICQVYSGNEPRGPYLDDAWTRGD